MPKVGRIVGREAVQSADGRTSPRTRATSKVVVVGGVVVWELSQRRAKGRDHWLPVAIV